MPPSLSITSRSGGGQTLPAEVRERMEEVFRADFSNIRIHVGQRPAALGAIAFTQGSEIFFAQGHYNPTSLPGQRLLGHELTHVLQQRSGRVPNPTNLGVVVVQDPILEAEAERMGIRVAQTLSARHGAGQLHSHGGTTFSPSTTRLPVTGQRFIQRSLRSAQPFHLAGARLVPDKGVLQRMEFDFPNIEHLQVYSHNCWAAALGYVFKKLGIPISQKQITNFNVLEARFEGFNIDEMFLGLLFKFFKVRNVAYKVIPDEGSIRFIIDAEKPIVVGVWKPFPHYLVVTDFDLESGKVTIYDPWDSTTSKVSLKKFSKRGLGGAVYIYKE